MRGKEIEIGDEVAVMNFSKSRIEYIGDVTGISGDLIGITTNSFFFRHELWSPKEYVQLIER